MNNLQQSEMQLWEEYNAKKDRTLKKQLINSLTPVIKSQVNKFSNSGVPIAALELEGKRLASKALDSYDPTKSQLNTHVITNLQKLSRFTTNYQNIGYIPEPRALMIGRYNTMFSNLYEMLGREPSITELAEALRISSNEVTRLQAEMRNDLQMELPDAEEGGGGFHVYMMPDVENPETRQIINFVYFDADQINKKIMEYLIPGVGSEPKLTGTEIKRRLNLTDLEYTRRRNEIAAQIKELQ
jgi:DNA-directed RNA polymerase specialized sigma subunit